MIKRILFLLAAMAGLTFSETAKAQHDENLKSTEKQKAHNFFTKNVHNRVPDSTMICSFAFRVLVKKDNFGKPQVVSINTNDSIAYTIYPDYKFLQTLNYAPFMRTQSRAVFVFPVTLLVQAKKGNLCSLSTGELEAKFSAPFYSAASPAEESEPVFFPAFVATINTGLYD